MPNTYKDYWRNSLVRNNLGKLSSYRAIGELPEMESSKAVAQRLKKYIGRDYKIVDVGCCAGNLIRSLDRINDVTIAYTGVDNSDQFLNLGRKNFANRKDVEFVYGDAYDLPFNNAAFDIVVSDNLFTHLPSVAKPISELCRVSSRYALFRLLVSEQSYQVKLVMPDENGKDFLENGEPRNFYFSNIYSSSYIERILSQEKRVTNFYIEHDEDFSADAINQSAELNIHLPHYTQVKNGRQVNGCIILPQAFVHVEFSN